MAVGTVSQYHFTHTPKQTQGKRRSEKLLMGDLKIATVSAPPLGPGDASATDAVRKRSPTPDSPAAAADDNTNASNNSSAASSPAAVGPLDAVPASAAKELVVVGTNTTDSATRDTTTDNACVIPHIDALDDIVGDSSEETGDANDPSRNDANGAAAAGAVVVMTETVVSDESDTVVTDENESAPADEPPPAAAAAVEDPVELADAEVAAVENGDAKVKPAQSDVHRKRKRSKRLGFSGSRPKQKRQSACPPLQVHLLDSHENGHADAPESPIFLESAVLYPSVPSEGMAWDWSMSNVYYDPLTQENLDHLVCARKSCANIIAANVETCKGMQQANSETAHLTAMLKDSNDVISSRVRPMRRGRRYRDVWEEEDFLCLERKRDSHSVDKKHGFSDQVTLLSNHELVHGYDDELFENYVSKLEAKAGHLSTPIADADKGGAGFSAQKSNTSGDTKPEPTRKGAKQKQQKKASLQENVVPDIPLDQCHPAAWGNWIIKKQTTSFDGIHPASLCRKKVSRRWKEELEALEQLKTQQESVAENGGEDEVETELDTTRPLAEQCIVPIATSMWGNGKDDVTKLPSFGTVVEDDEISQEISGSLAKLIPLSMYNWRLAQSVYERAATYAQCSSVLEQEAALAKQIEELYQRLYPARDSSSEDTLQDGRVPVFHSRHVDLIAHSLKFCRDSEESHCVAASVEYALTLQVGDEVDVLDRNGCWNDGVVVEVFCEHGRLVKYVLLRFSLWDAGAVEWVSVTEGRVLPRGVADGKMSFTVGPTRFRKRRIEFNRALADMLEKTFSVRHVEQNAAAVARKVELAAASSSEHAEDAKLQKKRARRGV